MLNTLPAERSLKLSLAAFENNSKTATVYRYLCSHMEMLMYNNNKNGGGGGGATLLLACMMVLPHLVMPLPLPLPQNPFEQVQLGAMTVAGTVVEAIQNGAAVKKDIGFETPLLGMHSKTAVGMGDAMRERTGTDSDSDSDERRRRRRRDVAKNGNAVLKMQETSLKDQDRDQFEQHLRHKRAPCMGSSSGGGGGDTADPIEEARRRMAKLSKNKRATTQRKSSTASKAKKKKTFAASAEVFLQRQRRQLEQNEMGMGSGSGMSSTGEAFGEKARRLGERMRNLWDGFVTAMSQTVQQLTQTVTGGGNGGGNGNGGQPGMTGSANM